MPFEEVTGLPEDQKIPYYCCELPNDFFEKVKEKQIQFYESDGRTIFEVRNPEGKVIGHVFYIIWR